MRLLNRYKKEIYWVIGMGATGAAMYFGVPVGAINIGGLI